MGGGAAPMGDKEQDRGTFVGLDCSSSCPGICVGWEAQPSPRSDALVEKVSGAGHGSHSHPQEKPRAKVILEKKKKKQSFLFSFLVAGTRW